MYFVIYVFRYGDLTIIQAHKIKEQKIDAEKRQSSHSV